MPLKAIRRLRIGWNLWLDYLYDWRRYRRSSSTLKHHDLSLLDRRQLDALILKTSHTLEKGLALKYPRPGFGQQRVKMLLEYLNFYNTRYGIDDTSALAISVLTAYQKFNATHGIKDTELEQIITEYLDQCAGQGYATDRGGVKTVDRDEILRSSQIDVESFLTSRHSVRQFGEESVPQAVIERAVTVAQSTPSVCNRQPWRVYAFDDMEMIQKLLAFQNGNRGFGDQADKLLIVAADMRAFVSPGERNQCWIDGGMFAMSLVYALHALGLGTCCLNWSVERDTDRRMRDEAGIPDYEAVIMMLVVGNMPKHFQVAQSPRKMTHEVLQWVSLR